MAKKQNISPRWAFEDPKGVTCYVYSPTEPKHMLTQGIRNLRPCGYYDYELNVIVSDEITVLIEDPRAARG